MKIVSLALISLLTFLSGEESTKEIYFDVLLNDEKIGHFIATETLSESGHVRDLKTNSSTTIIAISVHVETEATLTRKDGVLTQGVAYRSANRGVENVHAKTDLIGDNKYKVNRNGKSQIKENFKISWCVTDLFFKEPKGVEWVYSNMHAQKLPIKHLSNGKYQVVSPEDKDIYYIYENGLLMRTETPTAIGTIISKRK